MLRLEVLKLKNYNNSIYLKSKSMIYFLEMKENPCSIYEARKSLEVMESFVYGH